MVPAGKKDANDYPVGNDVTADVAIRRAINYAINRKQLAEQVMEGHAIPPIARCRDYRGKILQ
ncbi:ABC-type transporter, periplasmic subunit [Salmonella enterica subsp. enterica serovar Typhimurium]|nr:ABC-type transporter, periplasmic subunit [Salmonella enterica subsp. enterica serovar Typhimurium]